MRRLLAGPRHVGRQKLFILTTCWASRILTDGGGRKAFIQEARTAEGAEVEAEGQDAFADSVCAGKDCAEENPGEVSWARHCRTADQARNSYEIVQAVEEHGICRVCRVVCTQKIPCFFPGTQSPSSATPPRQERTSYHFPKFMCTWPRGPVWDLRLGATQQCPSRKGAVVLKWL